ncbi:MAG TPA: ABC transporter ATP-binding protein [Aeromonadales bacterium]|nr:ABC transporter ATP-binding protein [Aeromonadales bacterium]
MRENKVQIIQLKNINKRVDSGYEHIQILQDINFEVEAGESIAIVGASGSGKSTLLGLMAGLDLPSSGDIIFNGRQLTQLSEDERAGLRSELVGFVFQNFYLVPGLTVVENVMLPLEITKTPNARKRAEKYLKLVGLEQRLKHLPKQLSGGEQQRVALARAFVAEPAVLFADEPTGNLDQHTGQQIIDLLFGLNQASDTTLILVTHDESLAHSCQRKLVLDNGRIQTEVNTADV